MNTNSEQKYLMAPTVSPATLTLIGKFEQLVELALVLTSKVSSPGGPSPGSMEIVKKWEEAFEHCVSFLLLLCGRSKKAPVHMRKLKNVFATGVNFCGDP